MTTFITMGNSCEVPAILNIGGLRTASMPFDWVGAYPTEIKHSLDTDFSDWLDVQYINVKPKPKNADGSNLAVMTEHSLYSETGNRLNVEEGDDFHAFYHFNLLDQATRDGFDRKFARYRSAISSNDIVVFVSNNSPEEMKSAGVHDFYSNRNAKTVFVYLKEITTNRDHASLTKDGEFNIIEFGYADESAAVRLFSDLVAIGPENFYSENNFNNPNSSPDAVCTKICELISSLAK